MGIPAVIEQHRRDPDPHPGWERRLIQAVIDQIDIPGGIVPTPLSDATPHAVQLGISASPGSSTAAARGDHTHPLMLPAGLAEISNLRTAISGGMLTLAAVLTADRAVQFPDQDGTVAFLERAQTFTEAQTIAGTAPASAAAAGTVAIGNGEISAHRYHQETAQVAPFHLQHGFDSRTDATLAFVAATRVFTLAPPYLER